MDSNWNDRRNADWAATLLFPFRQDILNSVSHAQPCVTTIHAFAIIISARIYWQEVAEF